MKTEHHTRRNRILLSAVLVGAITLAGLQSAGAGPWQGKPGRWAGPGCGECAGPGYPGQQLSEQTIEARNVFLAETAELRKAMAVKRAEKRALMLSDNPDSKRVAELTGEIFDLREQLQDKAREKGLTDMGIGRGAGRGCNGPRGFAGRL
ncbi:MAG: hypothetical protein Kow0089_10450 [Desulfobulbaceae bacterium]